MAYNRKDRFYQKARDVGYRSRAAYKLVELAHRYRLLRSGDRVVDLGSWPGSWLQVAHEIVGPNGIVVGIDLQRVEPIASNVICLTGDVRDPAMQQAITERVGSIDVVLSDLAPKLTGIRARDEAQIEELADMAVSFAERILRPGGRFLMKTFSIPDLNCRLAELRRSFQSVKVTRPDATRTGSSEVYVVALDRRSTHTSSR